MLVGDALALSVSVQHKPRFEQHRRLSLSCSASSSSHEAGVTAGCSKSSVDMHTVQNADAAQPQTLAECQEFIRRLEADSVKQAHEVFVLCKLVLIE